jgi:hypothetical protein
MLSYLSKILFTAIIITLITELTKRSGALLGSILAALPLTSILALIMIYLDTKDKNLVSELSFNIFWLVIPSLIFFILLPLLLNKLHFWVAIGASLSIMLVIYSSILVILKLY